MYNCNFEAKSKVLNKRMKKFEMEYGQLIVTIIFYLILYIRFRKELFMLSFPKELLTFSWTFLVIPVGSYNCHLNYKYGNFF